MKVVHIDLLLANRTVLLLGQPVLDTVAVIKMFTLQYCNVLTLVDLIVTYAADLFGEVLL